MKLKLQREVTSGVNAARIAAYVADKSERIDLAFKDFRGASPMKPANRLAGNSVEQIGPRFFKQQLVVCKR